MKAILFSLLLSAGFSAASQSEITTALFEDEPGFAPNGQGTVNIEFLIPGGITYEYLKATQKLADENSPVMTITFEPGADTRVHISLAVSTGNDPNAWLKIFNTMGIDFFTVDEKHFTPEDLLKAYH